MAVRSFLPIIILIVAVAPKKSQPMFTTGIAIEWSITIILSITVGVEKGVCTWGGAVGTIPQGPIISQTHPRAQVETTACAGLVNISKTTCPPSILLSKNSHWRCTTIILWGDYCVTYHHACKYTQYLPRRVLLMMYVVLLLCIHASTHFVPYLRSARWTLMPCSQQPKRNR